MFFETLLAVPFWSIFPLLWLSGLAYCLHNRYGHGLGKVPGPFFASCSDYWRLLLVKSRRPEVTYAQLHEQHGDIVRIGPKTVLVNDWNAVKKIYSLNSGYVKVSPTSLTLTLTRT